MSIKKGKKQVYKGVADCSCCQLRLTRHCLPCIATYHPESIKPKKSIKKMYKAKWICSNCAKTSYFAIPYGVRAIDHLGPRIEKQILCQFCGCY